MQFLDYSIIHNHRGGFPFCPLRGCCFDSISAEEYYYLRVGNDNSTIWNTGRRGSAKECRALRTQWEEFLSKRIAPVIDTAVVAEFLDSSLLADKKELWDNTVLIKYTYSLDGQLVWTYYSIVNINADTAP